MRSEHLLLALAREGEGVGARLLAERGVVYEALRRRLDRAPLACSFCARSGLDVDHLILQARFDDLTRSERRSLRRMLAGQRELWSVA